MRIIITLTLAIGFALLIVAAFALVGVWGTLDEGSGAMLAIIIGVFATGMAYFIVGEDA